VLKACIRETLNVLVNEVEKGITKASEEVNKAWSEATYQRFRKSFSELPADERLLGEYWAQCVTGGKGCSCSCYVSTNFLSFVVELPTGRAHVMIPLRDIVNIQPAVALRSTGMSPVVQPVVDAHTRPDAIQVYTRDMKLHQFFSFLHFDKAYYALLHAWQTVQPPQQTTTQYLPSYSAQSSQPVAQPSTISLDKPQQPTSVMYPPAPIQTTYQQPVATAAAYPPPQQVLYPVQGAAAVPNPYIDTTVPQQQQQQPSLL